MCCLSRGVCGWCESSHEPALWSRISRGLHVSNSLLSSQGCFDMNTSTPWLTTRRRTCPICKGDVVRSLARGSPSSPRYEHYHDDSDDDFQTQAAETVNTSSTAALPIPHSVDDESEEDLEQGIVSPTPTRPRRSRRPGSWRELLASSLGSASRSPRPQEDRSR